MTDWTLRRELRPEDRAPIGRILRASGAFRDEDVSVGLELVDETLSPRPDTNYLWVLADRDGDLVGFACYGLVPMTDGTYDLYWIAVAPEVRGSGVATALDRAVADDARSRGGRWVLAETSSTSTYAAARGFYVKSNYTLKERIPDFYRDGDDRLTFGKRL